jgi:hypothetical protein
VRGFADFYQRFFGETPSQKNPRYLCHINQGSQTRKTPTSGPPPTKSVIYAALGLPPRGGTPSLIPPKALVVVDVAELAHKPMPLGASAVHYCRPGARTRPGRGGGAPYRQRAHEQSQSTLSFLFLRPGGVHLVGLSRAPGLANAFANSQLYLRSDAAFMYCGECSACSGGTGHHSYSFS